MLIPYLPVPIVPMNTGVNGDIYRYISPFFSKISVLGSESIYIPIYIYPHPFRFFLSCGAKSIYIPIPLYIFSKIFAPAARIYIYPHLYISPYLFDFFSSKMDLYMAIFFFNVGWTLTFTPAGSRVIRTQNPGHDVNHIMPL